jgi:ADP-L-glycero-D-manno-heptose 6-epimerase
MAKKIVITGGAGFIGCNMAAALNARGADELVVVDSLGSGNKWQNLSGLRYEDILSPEEFLSLLDHQSPFEADAIIHLGACSATTEQDADFLLQNNYRYTRIVCEWCLHHDVRFIYASSAATYGDGSNGYSDDDSILMTLRPLNMYGYSKHMFDLWASQHGLLSRIVGLKYFNVFGPHEEHKGDMRSMVSKAYDQIKEFGKIRLFRSYRPEYADGEQKRDFIYVKDAAAVTTYFLEHRELGGLFNCGTGHARTWKDLAMAVFKALNLQPQIEFIEMPAVLQGKYQYFTEAPMNKLRAAGYSKPFTPLEEAVRDYISTYLVENSSEENRRSPENEGRA